MTQNVCDAPVRVLHFICPTGFYGAERWVLSLVGNMDTDAVVSELVVIDEDAAATREMANRFQALGLKTHELSAGGRFDPRVVGRLGKLLRERNIDVLHTHGYKPDILGVLAARKAGVRTVCTTHGFESTRDLKLRLYMWLGCQAFRFFDRVVPLSEQLYDVVRRYATRKERVQIIQSGVDLRPIEPYIETREPGHYHESGPLTVGFIGRMVPGKNVRALLDVFDDIARNNPDVRLELVGDGDEREQLEHYAGTLDSSARIRFHGFVDDPLAYLQQFDLFVMTSNHEGTPLCLMEAMAMGVPVAAFDIVGVDLLIEQNKTGLMASHGDRARLVYYCNRLLDSPKLSRELATAARKRVFEQFSAARMADDYAAMYRTVVTE